MRNGACGLGKFSLKPGEKRVKSEPPPVQRKGPQRSLDPVPCKLAPSMSPYMGTGDAAAPIGLGRIQPKVSVLPSPPAPYGIRAHSLLRFKQKFVALSFFAVFKSNTVSNGSFVHSTFSPAARFDPSFPHFHYHPPLPSSCLPSSPPPFFNIFL